MTTPERPASSSLLSRVGFYVAAFAVFLCGWLGMQTQDRRLMVLYAVLALAAAALASAFARRR